MTHGLPVRLFLNYKVKSKIGEVGQFPWWLINTGTEVIGSVTVELHQSSSSEHIELKKCVKNSLTFKPGQQLKCPTSFTAKCPGHQALEVRVTLLTVGGKRISLKSKQDLSFYFENTSGSSTIEIKGSGIVKKMPPGTVVKIKKDAIVNWQNADDQADSPSFTHQEELCEDDVYEIQLDERMPDGLSPLDLSIFSEAWQFQCGKSVDISFVDASGQCRNVPARVGDVYCLQIRSYVSGYLTLIARGTSGRYMILAPNTLSNVRTVLGQKTSLIPGDLLPEPLEFCDSGIEIALALVTPELLILEPTALFNDTDETINYAPEGAVYGLLELAQKRFQTTALGFVQITVKE